MKKLMVHNAFFRLLAPPIYGVLVYLLILLINNQVSNIGDIFSGQEVYFCIGLTYLVSETLRILTLLTSKYKELDNKIILFLIGGIMGSIFITTAFTSAYFNLILDFTVSQSQLMIFNLIFGFSSLLYNLLFLSQLYMQKENTRHLKEEKLMTEAVIKQLNQFKHEVNPHLLYGSLETLITLIHKNTEESEDFIDELSSVYRYILSTRNSEFTLLEEELKVVNSIIYLLNYSHYNAIKINAALPEELMHSSIVPGTLTNLIEQIIRSTIINENAPLEINLTHEPEEDYLVIQHQINDKLNYKEQDVLSTIQETYAIYSELPVIQVRAGDQEFIKIPLPEVMEETLNSNSVTVNE